MKKIILGILFLPLLSCEKIQLKDLRGFNGFIRIHVDNLTTPIHSIDKPIKFEVKQGLSFVNIVNKNKRMTFEKSEIQEFSLGLSIIDTLGRKLKMDEDFRAIQNGTTFSGERIFPIWNTNNNAFESKFQISFLKKGIYLIYSDNPTLSLERDNFLFRDKQLTVDFDVDSRQIQVAKKYFSQHFENLDSINDDPIKNSTTQGLFILQIE